MRPSHDQTVNFDLMLASRAGAAGAAARRAQAAQVPQAIQQLAGNGAQSLSLMSALSGDTEAAAGAGGASGAALPSMAGNSDFSGDSVAITGQSGPVSPMAGVDMDRIRDALETIGRRTAEQGPAVAGGLFGGGGRFAGGGGLVAADSVAVGGGGGGGLAAEGAAISAASIPASRMARFLDGQQLGFECGAFQPAWPAAGAAGFRHQSLRHHVHERAVHSHS